MSTIDPSRIGRLEPGRQTITIHDQVLGPFEVAAIVCLTSGACCGAPSLQALGSGVPEGIVFGVLVAAGTGAAMLASVVILAHWWWLGPTVLVLREGALTLTAARVTRTLAYADLEGAAARRLGAYSELVLVPWDGEPIAVPIGGHFRAEAMADAVEAAMRASPTAASPEDPEVRRALDRLRGTERA